MKRSSKAVERVDDVLRCGEETRNGGKAAKVGL